VRSFALISICLACNPLFGEDFSFRDVSVGGVGGAGGAGGSGGDTTWPSGNHSYRKRITVAPTSIARPMTNFPLAVQLSDADIAAGAQPDGSDLFFTTDNAITPMSFELERYGDGEVAAWVRFPSIGAGVETAFYIYYGAAAATQYDDVDATWSGVADAVWHLGDDPDNGLYTNAVGGMIGTTPGASSTPERVAGAVGNAANFDGNNDSISMGDPPDGSLDFGMTSFSVSLWVQVSVAGGGASALPMTKGGANPIPGYAFSMQGNTTSVLINDGTTDLVSGLSATALQAAVWHHLAVVVRREDLTIRGFVDGEPVTASDIAGLGSLSTSAAFQLSSPFGLFDGAIDEVRVYPYATSNNWVALSYESISSSTNFFVVGKEESKP
jgi:hypothetical protein